MTEFDFVVTGILLVSLLLGFWRGFIHEVLSLLGWPMAFMFSNVFAESVAELIPVSQEMLRLVVVYALLFIIILAGWGMLVTVLTRMLKAVGAGWADRALGGLFGALRGGLIVLVVVWLAGMTSIPERLFWREAETSRVVEDVALLTKAWLPDSLARRVRYGLRS